MLCRKLCRREETSTLFTVGGPSLTTGLAKVKGNYLTLKGSVILKRSHELHKNVPRNCTGLV